MAKQFFSFSRILKQEKIEVHSDDQIFALVHSALSVLAACFVGIGPISADLGIVVAVPHRGNRCRRSPRTNMVDRDASCSRRPKAVKSLGRGKPPVWGLSSSVESMGQWKTVWKSQTALFRPVIQKIQQSRYEIAEASRNVLNVGQLRTFLFSILPYQTHKVAGFSSQQICTGLGQLVI
ncbi:MAG: hypothetical protein HY046_10410 [Acidobacteria bacterium]|nr:hypothetical protein [Acidobacteriota bacterium]